MPYTYKKQGDQYCVYKKDTGEKVGCTDGTKEAVDKYLAALHINAKENILKELKFTSAGIKELIKKVFNTPGVLKKLGFDTFKDLLDHIKHSDVEDQEELEMQLKDMGINLVYEKKTSALEYYNAPTPQPPNSGQLIQQMKSTLSNFFQKLKQAPRDIQKDFVRVYDSITKRARQLTRDEYVDIVEKLEPIILRAGFKASLDTKSLTAVFLDALKQIKNLDTKIPPEVLAESSKLRLEKIIRAEVRKARGHRR